MIHDLCGREHTSRTAEWACWAVRKYYDVPVATPAQIAAAKEEAERAKLAERERRGRAVAFRREFNRRKRAEREAKRAAREPGAPVEARQ